MNWEEIIIDYYNGELESEEEKLLMEKIQQEDSVRILFEEYGLLHTELEDELMVDSGEHMASRFEEFLEKEKANTKTVVRKLPFRFLAYAASILLLISAGITIGINYSNTGIIERQNQELVLQLRQEMKDLINDSSVSNRITAVNVAYKSDSVDPEIVDMLLNTLDNDESPNVRLAAVEVLTDIGPSEKVSEAFKLHMNKEEDDFVKISIIQAFAKLKDKNAVYTLDKITQDEQAPKFIKDEAHIAQLQLNKI